MKLLSLTLKNFKGIKNFTLDTHGGNVNIYGDNATGKTTLFDSITWLLFGKDSSDGELRQHEVDDFEDILKEAVELEKRIGELKIFALRQGISIKDRQLRCVRETRIRGFFANGRKSLFYREYKPQRLDTAQLSKLFRAL